MAGYIDTKAIIADLNKTYDAMSAFHPQFYAGYQFAVNRLRAFPTADVAPVRHGRWEWKNTNEFTQTLTCSACGRSEYASESNKYCPNCGARMDGGADNGE